MAERQDVGVERDQAGQRRGAESAPSSPRSVRAAWIARQRRRAGQRCGDERLPSPLGQGRRRWRKACSAEASVARASPSGVSPASCPAGRLRGISSNREWVALRDIENPLHDGRRERRRDGALDQRPGRLALETGEAQLGDARARERVLVANGQEHRDRIVRQPLGGEAERSEGFLVEPVGVVDDQQERSGGGPLGQAPEHGGSGGEAIPRTGGDFAQHRLQPSERLLGRPFLAACAHDLEPRRLGSRVFEQRALADARRAPQDQRAALPRARRCEQGANASALGVPPQQATLLRPLCAAAAGDPRPSRVNARASAGTADGPSAAETEPPPRSRPGNARSIRLRSAPRRSRRARASRGASRRHRRTRAPGGTGWRRRRVRRETPGSRSAASARAAWRRPAARTCPRATRAPPDRAESRERPDPAAPPRSGTAGSRPARAPHRGTRARPGTTPAAATPGTRRSTARPPRPPRGSRSSRRAARETPPRRRRSSGRPSPRVRHSRASQAGSRPRAAGRHPPRARAPPAPRRRRRVDSSGSARVRVPASGRAASQPAAHL